MDNPWQTLPSTPPYLTAADRPAVLLHNRQVAAPFQIRHDVLPEPYLGNPDASVILLSFNPGFKESDIAFYAQAHVQALWHKNILHQPAAYPFYLLDPTLADDVGGNRWWRRKLKPLLEGAGVAHVARQLCIEFFPYHSLRYQGLKQVLPSQQYSFYLVRRALQHGAVIVIMRGEKLWMTVVPELTNYPQLYRLNSSQNVTLSPRNCPTGFPIIQALLQC